METYGVAIHPNGETFAITSNTGGVVIYDVSTGEVKQNLSISETAYTFCVAFVSESFLLCFFFVYLLCFIFKSPNGKLIACGSWGSKKGLLTIFDIENYSIIHSIDAHAMPIRTVTFSIDSSTVFTGSDDKHVNLYDVKESSLNLVSSVSGHSSWILDVACSPNRKYFATA